jgi:cytochrome c oxidase subunit 2
MRLSKAWAFVAALVVLFGAGGALADAPKPWEIDLQAAATPVMEQLRSFNNEMTYIMVAITALVLALLVFVIFRFNQRANPTPSRTTHNTVVEIMWTVVPILVLLAIVVPSFKLLYFAGSIPKPELTVKAIGHQWYWSYEYPDNGNFTFDANLVQDKDLKPGQLRLLTTDNPVVVPVDTIVRLQIASTDVIHSWSIPSFGVKTDAVPGRLNETWFKIERPGLYYGQCSQLCGNGHAYMPVMVEAKTKTDYQAWVAKAKKDFARADEGAANTQVAATPSN